MPALLVTWGPPPLVTRSMVAPATGLTSHLAPVGGGVAWHGLHFLSLLRASQCHQGGEDRRPSPRPLRLLEVSFSS